MGCGDGSWRVSGARGQPSHPLVCRGHSKEHKQEQNTCAQATPASMALALGRDAAGLPVPSQEGTTSFPGGVSGAPSLEDAPLPRGTTPTCVGVQIKSLQTGSGLDGDCPEGPLRAPEKGDLFVIFFCTGIFFFFLGPYPQHMEIPRLGVESEL